MECQRGGQNNNNNNNDDSLMGGGDLTGGHRRALALGARLARLAALALRRMAAARQPALSGRAKAHVGNSYSGAAPGTQAGMRGTFSAAGAPETRRVVWSRQKATAFHSAFLFQTGAALASTAAFAPRQLAREVGRSLAAAAAAAAAASAAARPGPPGRGVSRVAPRGSLGLWRWIPGRRGGFGLGPNELTDGRLRVAQLCGPLGRSNWAGGDSHERRGLRDFVV